MSREGSLEAPTRHVIDWQNPDFIDPVKLDAEVRRQFDVCHGCRRCFNLCNSFPRLFDLVDATGADEVHAVKSEDFKSVVDACTLCDMCFLTKCPYVPPHPFNIDFPHLILRFRAAEQAREGTGFFDAQLTATDRNGELFAKMPDLANWATRRGNALTRPAMEAIAGVDKNVELPKFHGKTLVARAKTDRPAINTAAPAHGRKAAIYATCFVNYNNPDIGTATLKVLAHNGVDAEVVYPGCCGMPKLEQGEIAEVAKRAKEISAALRPQIDAGRDIVALIPSCALMMKFEWPLIVPDDENVKALAQATFDVAEYIVDIAKKEGLAAGLSAVPGGVALHTACHARAQNMGAKGAELLRLIPATEIVVTERCSGHGGSWGVKKENFKVASKFGKQTAKRLADAKKTYLASECPLAGKHLAQLMETIDGAPKAQVSLHPIEIFAKAYEALAMPRIITHADILPMTDYGAMRVAHRKKMVEVKRHRRIHVGPYVTLHFENYDTMWAQVHEMLFIERGGEAQLAGELAAYNPLIPQGGELVATMLIEIEDERVRRRTLAILGHVEDMISLRFAGHTVTAKPEDDVERTTEEGKTSSVHFLHFKFTPEQTAAFTPANTQIIAAVAHPSYSHMAVLPEEMRASLAGDFS